MSQQETAAPTISKKKQLRKDIADKLAGALSDYKQELGEKKLAIHVKRVSKLISRDLEKSNKKKAPKKVSPKKAAKKAVKN